MNGVLPETRRDKLSEGFIKCKSAFFNRFNSASFIIMRKTCSVWLGFKSTWNGEFGFIGRLERRNIWRGRGLRMWEELGVKTYCTVFHNFFGRFFYVLVVK